MSIASERILVAVFDSTHVRFFEYKQAHGRLESVLDDVSSGLHHDKREIESDKPGRTTTSGGHRHSLESEHDARKMEKHNFVRAIALAIEHALDLHAYGKLVVVAPHRSIGEFRSVASDKVLKTVWREVGKEMANLPTAKMQEQLLLELRQPAE